jgi:hypothetical protein
MSSKADETATKQSISSRNIDGSDVSSGGVLPSSRDKNNMAPTGGSSLENGNNNTTTANAAITNPRLRKQQISAQQGLEEPIHENDYIFALTDAALYIFRKDCLPTGAVFRDAPVPVLFRCHPMHHLRELSIYFGLQRCMIQFSPAAAEVTGDVVDGCCTSTSTADNYSRYPDGDPRQNPSAVLNSTGNGNDNGDSSSSSSSTVNASTSIVDPRFAYAYVIVTRDKSQMHPIIEHFSNAYTLARQMFSSQHNVILAANLLIRSKDLDILHQIRHHLAGSKVICEIMHYQMLYQVWRKRSDVKVPRSIVLTPTHALLFYEELYTPEVQITLLDKAAYKNIVDVRIETASPDHITLVLRASPLITKTRKWRLFLSNQQALSRLYEAIKSCCADAKNLI